MAEAKKSQNENRDGLALIIGGLLVLALVFGAYSYFNRKTTENLNGVADSDNVLSTNDDRTDEPEQTEEDAQATETKGLGDRIKEFLGIGDEETSTTTEEESTEGDLNGNGASTTTGNVNGSADTNTATGTGGPIMWSANDYSQGDISGTNYTVKDGDTLWEIAEAKYGNGADWTRILEANSANIEFLPDGQQALIEVGQVLVLPN